jgi:hypothetical protein
MTFLVNIEYQNFTIIHIEKIILQVLLLFQDSKEQMVHGTEGHNAVYGPVRHQKNIIWTKATVSVVSFISGSMG